LLPTASMYFWGTLHLYNLVRTMLRSSFLAV